jgi:hypothetical protein
MESLKLVFNKERLNMKKFTASKIAWVNVISPIFMLFSIEAIEILSSDNNFSLPVLLLSLLLLVGGVATTVINLIYLISIKNNKDR